MSNTARKALLKTFEPFCGVTHSKKWLRGSNKVSNTARKTLLKTFDPSCGVTHSKKWFRVSNIARETLLKAFDPSGGVTHSKNWLRVSNIARETILKTFYYPCVVSPIAVRPLIWPFLMDSQTYSQPLSKWIPKVNAN